MPSLNVKYLPYGENTISLVRHLPEDLGTITAAKIKVDDVDGNALTAEDTAEVFTAATLNGAVSRLANTATLTASKDPTVGRVYRIQATGEEYDDLRLKAYNTSTKVATFYDRFRHNHATGAGFTGRWVIYTLDCSTTSTYTDGLECVISWYGFTNDDRVITNLVRVRKHWSDFGDLRGEFSKLYQRYEEIVPEGAWNALQDAAKREMRRLLAQDGVEFDFIVDTYQDAAADAVMCSIALQLALGLGDAWAAERELLGKRKAEILDEMRRLYVWSDQDDDGIRDASEYQRRDRPYPRRRL